MLRDGLHGEAYADCYAVDVAGAVSLCGYVEAFYTSPLFKMERWLLARFAARPSTDLEARELAAGERSSFAAWRVEARRPDELVLADVTGRTKSWLRVSPVPGASATARTRLWFGSAVVPRPRPGQGSGRASLGFAFHALLGFHKLYSRALLRAAVARLRRGRSGP